MKKVTDLLNNMEINWRQKFPDDPKPNIYEILTKRKYGGEYKLIGEITIGENFTPPFFWVVCYWTGDEPVVSKVYDRLLELLPDFDYRMVVF